MSMMHGETGAGLRLSDENMAPACLYLDRCVMGEPASLLLFPSLGPASINWLHLMQIWMRCSPDS